MCSENILNKIEPFNEIYFESCFYNAFFPVVRYFKRNEVPFLINSINYYSYIYEDNIPKLEVKYNNLVNPNEISTSLGINYETKTVCDNIIDDVKLAVLNGKPVIVWVDPYYISIRKDAYLKTHLTHAILVFGYDHEKFHVIEHSHHDNLSYEKRVITYKDLADSYNGFISNYDKEWNMPTFFAFTETHTDFNFDVNIKEHKSKYGDNLREMKELVINGINSIKVFSKEVSHLIADETLLKQNIEVLVGVLNDIINCKCAEKYKIAKLYGSHEDILNMLELVIDKWSKIRAVLAKFMYSSVYKQKDLFSAMDILNDIYNIEHKLFEGMLLLK